MRCTSPKTVGFKSDGKTLCWSPKNYSKEFQTFQLPCGKCISCRLEYARQWAQRCVHEASMFENNSFITLTYSEENLISDKLIYKDFQDFMKRLRSKNPHLEIGVFVTGEYGDQRKRPHWHALLFNYRPHDLTLKYTSDRGDEKWLKRERPGHWRRYRTKTKEELLQKLILTEEEIKSDEFQINWERLSQGKPFQISRNETRNQILKKKFDELQKLLKL